MKLTIEQTLYRIRKNRIPVGRKLESLLSKIEGFFRKENLDSAVVGLSGGVDSSLVYALLQKVASFPHSCLKQVMGVYTESQVGSSGQMDASECVKLLLKDLQAQYPNRSLSAKAIHLTKSAEEIVGQMAGTTPWAEGQLTPIMRTATFYYQAAVLQTQGFRSIVCGTMNMDEAGYIGYFGKASDAMADLQPIISLHKSEVKEMAAKVGVPKFIIDREPTGDVYNRKTDEELIGAPYDHIELFLSASKGWDYWAELTLEDAELYANSVVAIQKMHAKNEHKYRVGRPYHTLSNS